MPPGLEQPRQQNVLRRSYLDSKKRSEAYCSDGPSSQCGAGPILVQASAGNKWQYNACDALSRPHDSNRKAFAANKPLIEIQGRWAE